VELSEQAHHCFVQFLKDFGIINLFREKIDHSSGCGATVQKFKQLFTRVEVLNVYIRDGVLGSSMRLILELYCLSASRMMS